MSSQPPSTRTRNQTRSGPSSSRAMSPAVMDSDDEYDQFYGPLPSLTFDSVDQVQVITPKVTRARSSRSGKKKRPKNRQLTERGVGTDASEHTATPLLLPPPMARGPSFSDEEIYYTAADEEDMEVENLITYEDTDNEPPPAPTKNSSSSSSSSSSSFRFSLPSRSSTLTSIGSAESSESPRKRMRLEHTETPKDSVVMPREADVREVEHSASRSRPILFPSESAAGADAEMVEMPSFEPPELRGSSDLAFICHNKDVQARMDSADLSWGTQYEIARGVSDGSWTWEKVTPDVVQSLKGCNEQAASRVNKVLGRSNGNVVANGKIWAELDREQAAIIENKSRGLGLQGEWMGEPNWFGGQIQQVARILETTKGQYSIRLEKMDMRKSHRFGRYLGSRHLLQVKVPEKFENGHEFFAKKFILCGRVFVPFCVKDGNIYLLEIGVNYERQPLSSQGDQYRTGFLDLVEWHNPIALNKEQSVNKWIARFDLALSTSVPVLKFEPQNVHYMDDEYAEHRENSKIPTEKIFTDGCGFINGAALMAVARQMTGLGSDRDQHRPTAVQGRIFGAKGVWLLHPHDQSPDSPPRIWIRDSQVKVKLVSSQSKGKSWTSSQLEGLHPTKSLAHFIFDLVAPSRVSTGARLSRSTIMNVAHNGVPTKVLAALMKASLELEIKPLLAWTGPHADVLLHSAIDRSGRVTLSRIQRAAAGAARALGLTRWMQENGQEGDELDLDDVEAVPALEEAASLHERIICALQAGFSPSDSPHLYDNLRTAVSRVIEKFVKEYHITIPESADAFIVPDPYGVLNEGEIHFKSTRNLRDPLVYQYPDVLTGDVLIYRNPCRLPSDIQKVKAVQHPMLSEYKDIIVLPTKGAQSLASLLAGGDVDGDVAVCIYDAALVEPFRTHATCKEPPSFLADNFEPLSSVRSVGELWDDMSRLSLDESHTLLQRTLLPSLTSNFQIGLYSKCHENAAYAYGYNDPRTVRLGFMFNTVLDSRKTGLVVKPDVDSDDMHRYNRDPPPCMSDKPPTGANPNILKRQVRGPFILEELLREGKELHKNYQTEYDSLKSGKEIDDDLTRPFRQATELCDTLGVPLKMELQAVREHVEKCCKEGWLGIPWGLGTPSKHGATARSKKAKAENSKTFTRVLREFAQYPLPAELPILSKLGAVERVRASYAYIHKQKFAFAVAFRPLCMIKAEAKGLMPMTNSLGQVVSVPSSAVRVLCAQAAEFGMAAKDVS